MTYFDWTFFGKVVVTLLVIMDPIGNIPLFLGLVRGRTPRARRRAAYQSVLVALGVVTVFALLGQQILDYLGISVPALQGAGGLLLLLVALQLLTGQDSAPDAVEDVNIALVPLGTPLIAGPGAIVAVIVFVQRAHGVRDALAIVAAVAIVHLVIWLALRFSLTLIRVIRENGIHLLTRVFGLLLSAIAVQLIAEGAIGFSHMA
jgi:multiple antibiotic resistance protein